MAIQDSKTIRILLATFIALMFGTMIFVASLKNGEIVNPIRPVIGNYFQTSWQSESQFIVESILQDVAEMSYYAQTKKAPPVGLITVRTTELLNTPVNQPEYDVEISLGDEYPTVLDRVAIKAAIWDPQNYRSVANKLFSAFGLPAGSKHEFKAADSLLLLRLTHLDAETIQKANQEVSESLLKNLQDPALHESAAVILGAFMLRENSGQFFDIRSPLNRMSAHLVMFQTFTGGDSYDIVGKYGDAMLYTLMNDQAAALEKIAALNSTDLSASTWNRALKSFNNYDYRELKAIENPTLLEKLALVRALANSATPAAAWNSLSAEEKTAVPDYSRIIDQFASPTLSNAASPTVETWSEVVRITLPAEIKDSKLVYRLNNADQPDVRKIIQFLNLAPFTMFSSGSFGQVISAAQWGMQAQRHLADAIYATYAFLSRDLGLPAEAQQFITKLEPNYSGLLLYPFVRRLTAFDIASYHKSVDDGFKVTVATPHLVSPNVWNQLCYGVKFSQQYFPNPNPHVNEWHSHNPPPGTAYDPFPRMNHPSLVNRPDTVELLDGLHQLAPYDQDINFNAIKLKFKEQATYEGAEEYYKPSIEFSYWSQISLAKYADDRPADKLQLLEKAASVEPMLYIEIAEEYQNSDEDKAAGYYEKALQSQGADFSVAASNSTLWLQNYYIRHKMVDKADRLSQQAAAVFSHNGLLARAQFLKSQGRWDEALSVIKQMAARYNGDYELLAWMIDYRDTKKDPKFNAQIDQMIKGVFPDGQHLIALPIAQPPKAGTGIQIVRETKETRQVGLKRSDVIVGLQGIAVNSQNQYLFVRAQVKGIGITLLLWRGDHYEELRVNIPDNRLYTDFKPYDPVAATVFAPYQN